ncbi:MAG: hypothetical protein IPI43_11810 [Sandaracinaceae bacterium]|nr:hypothetical protein [Sandaracinaceae bacterium]
MRRPIFVGTPSMRASGVGVGAAPGLGVAAGWATPQPTAESILNVPAQRTRRDACLTGQVDLLRLGMQSSPG